MDNRFISTRCALRERRPLWAFDAGNPTPHQHSNSTTQLIKKSAGLAIDTPSRNISFMTRSNPEHQQKEQYSKRKLKLLRQLVQIQNQNTLC